MKRSALFKSLMALFMIVVGSIVGANEGQNKSAKVLEVNKTTEKQEVRSSQIGYRDTLVFYTFKDQKAVLKLQIDNKDTKFPMTGTIFLFADTVNAEDLKKWLNNQHSDGLFADVPAPTATQKLPAETCKVASHKLDDHTKETFGEYDNYSVTFEVKDYSDKKGISLKGFSGTAKVHVMAK